MKKTVFHYVASSVDVHTSFLLVEFLPTSWKYFSFTLTKHNLYSNLSYSLIDYSEMFRLIYIKIQSELMTIWNLFVDKIVNNSIRFFSSPFLVINNGSLRMHQYVTLVKSKVNINCASIDSWQRNMDLLIN